ncbi:MAG: hypothetical protein LBF61_11660, partial [Azoarcus sp.]|nr:hypothetical protein [Azoarcus sp.]
MMWQFILDGALFVENKRGRGVVKENILGRLHTGDSKSGMLREWNRPKHNISVKVQSEKNLARHDVSAAHGLP